MALPFALASTFRLSIWMLLRRFRRCRLVFRWLSMAHPCHLLKVGHHDPYGQAWSVFSNVNQFVIHIDSVNAQINEPSISLNYSQAIVWQIKYIVSIFLSKKAAVSATAELQYVSQTPLKVGQILIFCLWIDIAVREIRLRFWQVLHQGAHRADWLERPKQSSQR